MAHRFSFTKKIILLAALLLFLGSVVALAEQSVDIPDELFTFVKVEGGVEVTGYRGEGLAYIIVPEVLGDSTVVSVGTGAFWGNSDIVSVSLPSSVTRVGDNAFTDCKRLAQFSGESVADVGDYAFYGCGELAGVILSGYCDTIGVEGLGNAVPRLSVSDSYSIDSLLSVQQLVARSGGQVLLGSVGDCEVTPEMLELNKSLVKLFDETLSSDVDKLWRPDIVTIANPDGSVYTTGFVDFYGKLRSTGLYSIIGTFNCARLDARLDAMLVELLDDAGKLQQ